METSAPPVNLIDSVKEAWVATLRKDSHSGATFSPSYVYASGIKSCTRQMALDLLHPEEREPFTDEALARMRKGTEREDSIVAWLAKVGRRCVPAFKVIEGQRRFEIKDRDGVVLVVGKVDCRLAFENGEKPFVEVKSGEGVRRIETLEDFDRSPWTRHMPDQLLSYLYAENQPWGMFVLDRPGLPQFVPVPLMDQLPRVERILGNVRRAIDVKLIDAPLPPYIEDRSECRRCPHFGKSCTPPLDFGPGVPVLSGLQAEVLSTAAETMERTRASHEEYEDAKKLLDVNLRGAEMTLFGDYQAIGKWSRMTKYDIPDEVKKPYARLEEHGRFTLKVERIAGEIR